MEIWVCFFFLILSNIRNASRALRLHINMRWAMSENKTHYWMFGRMVVGDSIWPRVMLAEWNKSAQNLIEQRYARGMRAERKPGHICIRNEREKDMEEPEKKVMHQWAIWAAVGERKVRTQCVNTSCCVGKCNHQTQCYMSLLCCVLLVPHVQAIIRPLLGFFCALTLISRNAHAHTGIHTETHTVLCIVLAQVSSLPSQKEQPVLKAQLLQGHLVLKDKWVSFIAASAQAAPCVIPMSITLTQHTERICSAFLYVTLTKLNRTFSNQWPSFDSSYWLCFNDTMPVKLANEKCFIIIIWLNRRQDTPFESIPVSSNFLDFFFASCHLSKLGWRNTCCIYTGKVPENDTFW